MYEYAGMKQQVFYICMGNLFKNLASLGPD